MESAKLNSILLIFAIALLGYNTVLLSSNDGAVVSASNDVTATTSNTLAKPPITAAANQPVVPSEPSRPATSVKFKEETHDFGSVKQDTENAFAFEFTNTGVEPLVIENAKGSCGCTVPNYPKEPIMPGESATIDVVYKPGKQQGPQQKTVTITANTEPKNTVVKIKADVQAI